MTATDELRRLLDERGVEYDESTQGNTTLFRFDYCDSCNDYLHTIAITGACISAYSEYLTPEQAIAATLGTPISADLRTALDFMRIWITDDAHLGESAISYEFEKAEGLRKLDAIESAIAATLGSDREAELEALAKDLYENAVDFNFKGWMPYYRGRFAALGIEVDA